MAGQLPGDLNADLSWASQSATQRLANINQAIRVLEAGGQSYSIGGRSFNRGQLSTYYEERRTVEAEVVAESGKTGGLRAYARFNKPN